MGLLCFTDAVAGFLDGLASAVSSSERLFDNCFCQRISLLDKGSANCPGPNLDSHGAGRRIPRARETNEGNLISTNEQRLAHVISLAYSGSHTQQAHMRISVNSHREPPQNTGWVGNIASLAVNRSLRFFSWEERLVGAVYLAFSGFWWYIQLYST
jgi:hypothetical protein